MNERTEDLNSQVCWQHTQSCICEWLLVYIDSNENEDYAFFKNTRAKWFEFENTE